MSNSRLLGQINETNGQENVMSPFDQYITGLSVQLGFFSASFPRFYIFSSFLT